MSLVYALFDRIGVLSKCFKFCDVNYQGILNVRVYSMRAIAVAPYR